MLHGATHGVTCHWFLFRKGPVRWASEAWRWIHPQWRPKEAHRLWPTCRGEALSPRVRWEINLMRPQWQKHHQKRPGKSIKRYVSDGKRLEDSNGNLEVWTYEYQPIPGAPFSHHQQFISRYSDKKLMQPFAAGHQCGLKAGALG